MKVILIFTLLISTFTFAHSQCPNGFISIQRQSQVDSFIIEYPNCTEFFSSINIGFSNVNNLEGFRNLTSVNGAININYNPELKSLEGFRNLEHVGFELQIRNCPLENNLAGLRSLKDIGNFYIEDCDSLKSFRGIDNLTHIANDLEISRNDNLEDIEGLHRVKIIGTGFVIDRNTNLKNLNGLRSLENLTDENDCDVDISILFDNPNLESLKGLEKLKVIGGLSINNCYKLTSLEGLSSLDTIHYRGLQLRDNENLQSLEGAPLLKHINGKIDIRNNPSLTSLSGLDEVDATAITDLIIKDNESLSSCAIYSICEYLDLDGPRDIEFNLVGCNNEDEIQDACELVATSEIDSKLLDIDIGPIPTQDYLQVSLDPLSAASQFRYFIYDTTVKELLSGRSYSRHASIDVSYLSAGVYTILIDVEGTRSARLWVKI